MNFVDLVELIVAWKDREETYDLKEDTSYSPVVAICKETFRWPVPPGWNVFCKWRLGVDASAWSKVCQLHLVVLDQDILSTLAFRVKVREGGRIFEELTVWCLYERYRFCAYDLLIWGLDTWDISLCFREGSASFLWLIHTCSYPSVQIPVPICQLAHH